MITKEMFTDDCDESGKLETFYHYASKEQREIIDMTLIYICGWSLPTLKEKVKQEMEGE
jgi:uncharacterized membrane protein YhdT